MATSDWADNENSTPIADMLAAIEALKERARLEWSGLAYTQMCAKCYLPLRPALDTQYFEGVTYCKHHTAEEMRERNALLAEGWRQILARIDFSKDAG